uniref:Uncharacterized protein n=2 Tax=Acrobeloides nanus TaxID=290746 RepID=A0A914D579_9BILA
MRGPSSDKEPLLNEIESLADNLVPYGKDIEVIKIRTSICNVQNVLLLFLTIIQTLTPLMITYQLRILTTALLMVILLNKIFSGTQWAALFISLLGVILVQASSQTSAKAQEANPEKSEQFLGLMTVLGMCWMTAFAGVYLERVLKKSSFDIWLQNIHLSTITLPFALLTIAYDSSVISQYGFFYGWSPLVWVVSITGAVGGLIIAAVMKYADNIKKCFSTSVALGGTSILSILMGDSVFSFLLMFGPAEVRRLGVKSLMDIPKPLMGDTVKLFIPSLQTFAGQQYGVFELLSKVSELPPLIC